MRCYGTLVLVMVAADVVAVQFSYHRSIGIPTAKRIKDTEDAIVEAKNDRTVGDPALLQTFPKKQPYLGGLIISIRGENSKSVCGSSLITKNRLVSAAHCWFDGLVQAQQFVVVLNTQFLFSGGIRIPTSDVVAHPRWNPTTLANDIAIIKVGNDVPFSEDVHPISLPFGNELHETFEGQWALASGFGQTGDDKKVTTSTRTNYAVLRVIPLNQCKLALFEWILNSHICTSGDGRYGICYGDSGGPLVIFHNGRDVLVGISSFVSNRGCQAGLPSVYTRVSSFYYYIMQNL